MRRAITIVCTWALLVASEAMGQSFTNGELAITGGRISDNRSVIELRASQGAFVRTLLEASGDFLDICFGANGLLYAAGGSVIAYSPAGTPAYVFPTEQGGGPGLADLSFARDGSVLALWTANRVVIYRADGTRLRHVDIPNLITGSVSSIDLGADQCTLYFTAGPMPITFDGAVGRINVCVSGSVPNYLRTYPSLLGADIRVLPTGELLVARRDDGVDLLTAAGDLIRSFAVPGSALAISPDGRSFYVSNGIGPIQRIDLTTGATLASFPTGIGVVSLAVVGDPRVALAVPGADIPALSRWLLGVLAVSLAVAAISAIWR